MAWPMVELGEVVSQRKVFITIEPDVTYSRCRVQTSARGVVLRDRLQGSEVKTKRQQVCRAGDFLVAEIDAKMGGYGLVPDELEGAIVSSHYFLYTVDGTSLDKGFLNWYCRTKEFLQQVNARGSTNYASIRSRDVLNYRIPLPPLDEQRRIVARLDRVARLVEERRRVLAAADRDVDVLLRKAFDKATEGADHLPMEQVAPLVRRPVDVQPDESYPELGVRSFGRGTFHKPALDGTAVGTKKLYRIATRDLVFNIVFAWEGAVAIARDEDEDRVGSHRFLTCVPDPGGPSVEFLLYYFLSREGLRRLGEASPGGAGRNRTLGLKKLAAITVPVPSPEKQRWFDRLLAKVRALRKAHAETSGELDALIPAMLHEVFGGEAGCSVA